MKSRIDKEVNKIELNEVISLSKRLLKILYFVFIAVLILAAIFALQSLKIFEIFIDLLKVISPFFIGFFVAWLLRPFVIKLTKKTNSNLVSSIIAFLIFLFLIILLL